LKEVLIKKKKNKSFHPILNPMFEIKNNMNPIKQDDKTQEILQPDKSITDGYYKIESYIDEIVKNPFGEKWSDVVKSIKETSPFKNFETYSVSNNNFLILLLFILFILFYLILLITISYNY